MQHKSTEYLYLANRQIKEGNAQPSGFWCVLWCKRNLIQIMCVRFTHIRLRSESKLRPFTTRLMQ